MSQSDTLVWNLCKENTTQIVEQIHNQQRQTHYLTALLLSKTTLKSKKNQNDYFKKNFVEVGRGAGLYVSQLLRAL